MLLLKVSACLIKKEKTHLSAHRTVDGDDDKTLDGVKDGKEDLEEMGNICLLITGSNQQVAKP